MQKDTAAEPGGPSKISHDELYFGLVMWLGTEPAALVTGLKSPLAEAGYHVETIKISSLIPEATGRPFELDSVDRDYISYIRERMDAGDDARELAPSVLADLAIREISARREAFRADSSLTSQYRGIAYVLDSLMHPAEVEVLRRTYGSLFFLIAVQEDEDARYERVMSKPGIAALRSTLTPGEVDAEVAELFSRNRGQGRRSMTEEKKPNTLSIEKVFHLADVFVDASNPVTQRTSSLGKKEGLSELTLSVFLEQVFSHPHNVPTLHEIGMAHAFVEARRSAAITRQVGAAICTADGALVSVGCNEVPAPGGGQYPQMRNGVMKDVRDRLFLEWKEGEGRLAEGDSIDPNDDIKLEMLHDIVAGMLQIGLIPSDRTTAGGTLRNDEANELAAKLVDANPNLKKSKIFDIIEYTRAVHAEMAALLSAMRRGIDVTGCFLYCTTFPCHECARHIIAAGISKVFYIEPYPKSRVVQLHPDAVSLTDRDRAKETATDERVCFLPFIGIAPSRHPELFSSLERKAVGKDGKGQPAPWTFRTGLIRETLQSSSLSERLLEQTARDTKEDQRLEFLTEVLESK